MLSLRLARGRERPLFELYPQGVSMCSKAHGGLCCRRRLVLTICNFWSYRICSLGSSYISVYAVSPLSMPLVSQRVQNIN